MNITGSPAGILSHPAGFCLSDKKKVGPAMKKYKHFTLGGIQQKIFNLVLIMLILVMAVYAVVIFHQMNTFSTLVSDTSEKQKSSIADISERTMDAVIAQSLGTTTRMQAYMADDMFKDTADAVSMLGACAQSLFSTPENFAGRDVKLPDPETDGTASVQLLTEESVDLSDPALTEKLRLLGGLTDMMLAVYANAEVDSLYVALPDGVMLLVDDHASSKLDDHGNVISIPIHERDWYQGAAASDGAYYTDIVSDVFTGHPCIMCALPVRVNGQLAAVVGADLFLNNMEAYVNSSGDNGSFFCIVNRNGHVVFSPRKEGVFQVRSGSEAEDLRALGNADLAAFIEESLNGSTDVRLIEADDTAWYMTGAPIPSVGWSVISLVSKEVTDQPTIIMEKQHDDILAEAKSTVSDELGHSRATILVLLGVVTVLALTAALLLSRRIVKPLEAMTKRVISLGGEDLQFMMEDTYRTGDEIEALAESFATLSARTLQYVDQVRSVTAEKERIGTELSLAKNIQASMLPHIFPAFPERPEFDIYASMDPAKEVGGDFYDYFLVDDDHLCMVIADVSGKGVPAALFMMASKIILQSAAMMGCSPSDILQRANRAICSNNEAEMFVTVWLGILELSTGKLIASNAGHEYPALRMPGGPFEIYKDKHGFVIGGMEDARYRSYEIQLEPGSRLFLYTDGVAEATNADQELFGTDRMIEALNMQPDAAPKQLLKHVRSAVDSFVKDAEQFDDLTMLCVEYKGGNARISGENPSA